MLHLVVFGLHITLCMAALLAQPKSLIASRIEIKRGFTEDEAFGFFSLVASVLRCLTTSPAVTSVPYARTLPL